MPKRPRSFEEDVQFTVKIVLSHIVLPCGRFVFYTKCFNFNPDWKITTATLLDGARERLLSYLDSVNISIKKVEKAEEKAMVSPNVGPSSVSPPRATRAHSRGAQATAMAANEESIANATRAAEAAAVQALVVKAGKDLVDRIPPLQMTIFFKAGDKLCERGKRIILLLLFLGKDCGGSEFVGEALSIPRKTLIKEAIKWGYFPAEKSALRYKNGYARDEALNDGGTSLTRMLEGESATMHYYLQVQEAYAKGQNIWGIDAEEPWASIYSNLHDAVSIHAPHLMPALLRRSLRYGRKGHKAGGVITFVEASSGIGGFGRAAMIACDRLGVPGRVIASIDMAQNRESLHDACREPGNAKLLVARVEDVAASSVAVGGLLSVGVDVMTASTNCQPFSPLGNNLGWAGARDNVEAHFLLAEKCMARCIVFENSSKVLGESKKRDWSEWVKCGAEHGYILAFARSFNALDCDGAPPHYRNRAGMIFVRKFDRDAITALQFLKAAEKKDAEAFRASLPGRGAGALGASDVLEREGEVDSRDWIHAKDYRYTWSHARPIIESHLPTSQPLSFRTDRGYEYIKTYVDVSPTLTGNDGSSPVVLARRKVGGQLLRHYTIKETMRFGSWAHVKVPDGLIPSFVRKVVGNSLIPEWGAVLIDLAVRAFMQ